MTSGRLTLSSTLLAACALALSGCSSGVVEAPHEPRLDTGAGFDVSADPMTLPDLTEEAPRDALDAGVRDAREDHPSDLVSGADGPSPLDAGPRDSTARADVPSPSVAWLHADLWSVFWNDRTRCGAERTFLHQCERRGEDCSAQRRAVAACDPGAVVYGQVGPERQGERLCQRGRFPDVGGCDAGRYDFDRLRFWWYGAEWQGNWPFATLKVFPPGTSDPRAWAGRGLVAFSNLPGRRQAAMEGVENHGLDRDGDGRPDSHACVMLGVTTGDAAFRTPFGGFAWVEVPTSAPVTVVAAAGTNFADRAFEGCSRGSATQSPWLTGSPGASLGCVYALEYRFAPGRHYAFRYGRIEALSGEGPPAELVAGFALPEVGRDVRLRERCASAP